MSNGQQPDTGGDAGHGDNKGNPPPTIPPPSPPSGCPQDESRQEKKGFFERWKHEIEFAGLVGLVFYCWVNWQEWGTFDSERKTMEKEFIASQTNTVQQMTVLQNQLLEMQKTRESEERARAMADTPTFSPDESGSEVAEIKIQNYGRSPAFNCRVSEDIATHSDDIPMHDSPPHQNTNEMGFLIAPGESQPHRRFIPAGDFFIYGTVWYGDSSSTNLWSQFCFEVNCVPNLVTNAGVIGLKFSVVYAPGPRHWLCDDYPTNQSN